MEWIKTSERLPRAKKKVIVSNGKTFDVAYIGKSSLGEKVWVDRLDRQLYGYWKLNAWTHWCEDVILPNVA